MTRVVPDLSRGACFGVVDDDTWFPLQGHSKHVDTAEPARWVCQGCPVREICREWALSLPEPFGIWAGLTPDERSRINRRQRRKATT